MVEEAVITDFLKGVDRIKMKMDITGKSLSLLLNLIKNTIALFRENIDALKALSVSNDALRAAIEKFESKWFIESEKKFPHLPPKEYGEFLGSFDEISKVFGEVKGEFSLRLDTIIDMLKRIHQSGELSMKYQQSIIENLENLFLMQDKSSALHDMNLKDLRKKNYQGNELIEEAIEKLEEISKKEKDKKVITKLEELKDPLKTMVSDNRKHHEVLRRYQEDVYDLLDDKLEKVGFESKGIIATLLQFFGLGPLAKIGVERILVNKLFSFFGWLFKFIFSSVLVKRIGGLFSGFFIGLFRSALSFIVRTIPMFFKSLLPMLGRILVPIIMGLLVKFWPLLIIGVFGFLLKKAGFFEKVKEFFTKREEPKPKPIESVKESLSDILSERATDLAVEDRRRELESMAKTPVIPSPIPLPVTTVGTAPPSRQHYIDDISLLLLNMGD